MLLPVGMRRVVSILAMTAGASVGGLLLPAAGRKSRGDPPGPGAEAKRESIASWFPMRVVGGGAVP